MKPDTLSVSPSVCSSTVLTGVFNIFEKYSGVRSVLLPGIGTPVVNLFQIELW